jgi:hypothetical protein
MKHGSRFGIGPRESVSGASRPAGGEGFRAEDGQLARSSGTQISNSVQTELLRGERFYKYFCWTP